MKLPLRHVLLDVIEPSTGEKVGSVAGPAKRTYQHDEPFMVIFLRAAEKLSKMKIGEEARRVLDALIARTETTNIINVSQTIIAKELDLKKQSVHRAIKKLIENNIISEIQIHGVKHYYLQPHMGWKGTAKQLHELKQKEKRAKPKLRLASEDGRPTT